MQRHTRIVVLALAVFAAMPSHAADMAAPRASSAHAVAGAVAAPAERAPQEQPSAQLATPQPAFQIPKDPRAYIRPGAPAAASASSQGTTIAPFPVPWDSSRATAERMRLLNVPKAGQLTFASVPPDGRQGADPRAQHNLQRMPTSLWLSLPITFTLH
jgi:hypothetical protein